MDHIYNQNRLDHDSLPALWRAFLTGAGVFGADLPAACSRDIPKDKNSARRWILNAIEDAAIGRHVERGEVTPAGFLIERTPCALVVRFGSGRSVIELLVGDRESFVTTGVVCPDDQMSDPATAHVSAQIRFNAALVEGTAFDHTIAA